jgi:hypothetical protein
MVVRDAIAMASPEKGFIRVKKADEVFKGKSNLQSSEDI